MPASSATRFEFGEGAVVGRQVRGGGHEVRLGLFHRRFDSAFSRRVRGCQISTVTPPLTASLSVMSVYDDGGNDRAHRPDGC